MTSERPAGPRTLVAAALVCAGTAGLLAWVAATASPRLHVPPAIAYVAAAVLVLAAGRLLRLRAGTAGSGDGSAALMLAGMTAICLWISVGSGARACTSGTGLRTMTPRGGLACRVPFGVGALLVGAMALYAAARWLGARRERGLGRESSRA